MVKVTVNLPENLVDYLKDKAKAKNKSMTALIIRSLNIEKVLSDEEKKGSIFLIEKSDKEIYQVQFH